MAIEIVDFPLIMVMIIINHDYNIIDNKVG